MKRIVAAVLAIMLVLICVPFAVCAKKVTQTADAIDTARDSGKLVIYTSEFGATTATNEWGYEVTVGADNIVSKIGGNNSAIPEGGFVLSGHNDEVGSDMISFLRKNVAKGDYVYYDEKTLLITISDAPVEIKENAFYSVQYAYDGVNTTRWENKVILYTSGGTHTATNEWGYEVTVENGVVTVLGGNNSLVPSVSNSFVISAHGTAAEWLKANAVLGMAATYDPAAKFVILKYDEEAASRGLKAHLDSLYADFQAAKAEYRDIDYSAFESEYKATVKKLDDAVSAYRKDKDTEKFGDVCNAVADTIEDTLSGLLAESRTVEYRGVWIRPSQNNATEVDEYVQRLYDGGINLICIETIFDCTVIYPVEEGCLFETNSKFKSFDLLQSYIDACHKRNMELHLWYPNFYVGDEGSANLYKSLATKRPEWLSLSNTGKKLSDNPDMAKHNMLDPANDEAMSYLLSVYEYVLKKYDIDGFQLDYIRYANKTTDDFGYTESAINKFKEKYNVTPEFNESASYWKDWVQFRSDCITDFVKRVRLLIDEVAPDVLLGADVVPRPDEAKNVNYQDYMKWLELGLLDVLFPMAYGNGYEEPIAQQRKNCGDSTYLCVGLGIFMEEMSAEDMVRQASQCVSLKTDGGCYFEASAYLKKNTGSSLLKAAYKNRALAPNLDRTAALKAAFEFASNRVSDIMLALKGVTKAESASLTDAFNTVIGSIADGKIGETELAALKTTVATVKNEQAKAKILDDIAYAERIYLVTVRSSNTSDISELPDYSYETSSKAESAAISDSTDSTPVSDTSEQTENGDITPTIIIIACIVAVAAVVCGYIFILRKKK